MNMDPMSGQAVTMPPQMATSVTNIVVTTQPQTNGLMVTGLTGHRHWSTGLFGCFDDIPSCLLTCFCMPCMECKTASRIGECCCMPYCVMGGSLAMRTKIRTVGGIQGSVSNDSMTLCCCGPCATCQMDRELTNMGVL
ncbi:cornifelin-like isoform X2 [Mizuhopecten yessoensis]|uniref:Cornifelin n=2 Tax=Mizuhopecten yessoensis TaxID=6573 RepID=A0A210PUQ8_MIZYE|nr:cornifelin-like isoform X2 [Mizuhopecten yessoensis]XP_021374830.1 cornifelin-like isoform X2 [Mizuhopecten yessoensis]XP_021374831.1 cornifelin-like isoform X2 [Mizuhopecten yessoensis]OWF40192.1 Cornifelin [Mizuhopecten yessoensis]